MRFETLIFTIVFSITIFSIMPEGAFAEEEGENPIVICETSMGTIKIELFEKEAPITVKNFINYTNKKFYDGTIFHRVIPNFVIQGGGLTEDMYKKATGPPIENEADNGLKNLKGTLSMARTKAVNSATTQFFINLKDNKALDHKNDTPSGYGYAVFGKVIDGWDVVEKIRGVETTTKNGRKDVPKKTITIKSMRRYFPEDEGEKTETKEKDKEKSDTDIE